ncbi:MAG: hypothetical protein GX100_08670 [candidate division WS1 bacterium]|nr:hypothetical protein [candidate division WS1 bacterium]
MVFSLSLIVFGLILAYWAFIIFNGQLKEAQPTAVGVISHMGELLTLAAIVATTTFVVLAIQEVALVVVPTVVGLALFMGLPALVIGQLGGEPNEAAEALIGWGSTAGKAMLVVCFLRVIYEIYRSHAEAEVRRETAAREAAAQERKKAIKSVVREKPFAHCWEMPFCHEAVRELCPAYKARKSCWRFGRGCMCDADLIETLIMSRNPGPTRQAREVEAQYIRTELEATQVRHRSERTIPCSKCPIFAEHQRRKFRVVNPIIIGATVVAIAVAYVPLAKVYSSLTVHLAKLASGSILNPKAVDNIAYWREYLDTPALQGAFVVILGMFFLAWMLKLGEWLVLEKKVL